VITRWGWQQNDPDLQGFADSRHEIPYDPHDFMVNCDELVGIDSTRPIPESYIEGNVALRIELKTRIGGSNEQAYCSFIYRVAGERPLHPVKSKTVNSGERWLPSRLRENLGNVYEPVFVDVIDSGKNLKRVRSVAVLERLEPLDQQDRYIRKTRERTPPVRGIHTGPTVDRELQLIVRQWLAAIADRKEIDRIVESRPEAMTNIANGDTPTDRWLFYSRYPEGVHASIHIMLVIRDGMLVIDPRSNSSLQILDLRLSVLDSATYLSDPNGHDLSPSLAHDGKVPDSPGGVL